MDFKEILFLTYSSIKERKTRNALTILMIIMGCGLLVSLNSLSQGLIFFVEQNFKKILPNQIVISNTDKIQESSIDGIRNKLQVLFDQNMTLVGKNIPFDNKAIQYLKDIPGVQLINPAYQGVVMLNYQNYSQITNVLAADINNLTDIIPDLDVGLDGLNLTSQNYVIIPQKIGEKIFLNFSEMAINNSLNNEYNDQFKDSKTVTINNLKELTSVKSNPSIHNTFAVLRIINSTGNPIIDNSIFIDVKEGKEILEKSDDYDLLFLTYDDIDEVESIVKEVQKYFNYQVTILNSLEIVKSLTKFIIGISTFISSIAIFSLIVGSIGIIITIYTSVVERTREIGIIKALGGTNRIILGMFLTESVFLGVIGAIGGIVFGFLGSHVLLSGFLYFLNLPLDIYPVFNIVEISKIGLVVIILSIFSGLYPAYKGSKISPVNALSKYS
ncbi:ABC transporter permease [Candidatus Nitrosocosmicus arcticus]|uniref:ABC-type antimicrobial peptide transport system, permease component n=1 Tax=Candidatus Nitrosocosmicus arcticus TaxID=2035267 RepID=A0A557SSR4_9ARCH|nr:ABC transporter permease [Candidatus Nitrosocosmicus arcticus]TVP39649.1 ABC-type antimicrobial peptide transport system, permease component [Candidatus Nitrosocosmicus arcticus]